jgi:hypothetical protein
MKEKIGLVITTFNSESYFKDLYNTIPFDRLDKVVVVNGGEPYKDVYDHENLYWIQHEIVRYPSVARNDGLKYLLEEDIDHFFVCEDDMLIKDVNIFDKYINASKISGIPYFIYTSVAWDSGQKGERTPKAVVEYPDNTRIKFNYNMCNEFTYKTKNLIQNVGLYDEDFRYLFDVDYAYRVSQYTHNPFWYFSDLLESDNLIDNNSEATSRLDAGGQRSSNLEPEHNKFYNKHGMYIGNIPSLNQNVLIDKLKDLRNNVR